MSERVEMRPAFQWTCEDCGRDQFEPCIVAEMSPADRLEQAKYMGLAEEWSETIPEYLSGDFVTYPDEVTCQHCNATFQTAPMD